MQNPNFGDTMQNHKYLLIFIPLFHEFQLKREQGEVEVIRRDKPAYGYRVAGGNSGVPPLNGVESYPTRSNGLVGIER
uniref:Vesicle-fusing ATPase n=1 Tax=Rhizophora mucronata TaxID=61149 RepID=A0A2P2MVS1_RHIMU